VNGQPITVWKTAFNQKRPYLYLADASNAIIHIIQKNMFNGEIYNVLTSNSTVQDIIDAIKVEIPTLSIQLTDNQIMNQLSYNVSNDRFNKTGFTYHGSLKNGIKETLQLLGGISNWKDLDEKKK
jgi:nucleoside-diphosphate-sugar epimerase